MGWAVLLPGMGIPVGDVVSVTRIDDTIVEEGRDTIQQRLSVTLGVDRIASAESRRLP